VQYEIILHFGRTELKAEVAWKEDVSIRLPLAPEYETEVLSPGHRKEVGLFDYSEGMIG
jgi:hypothetical protein